jgi:MFS family permease
MTHIEPGDSEHPSPSAGVIALLRGNPPFRRLWIARAISFTGDSLGLMALVLYVAEEIGTGASVALLLLVGDVAPTLLSPLTGALSDRLDRTRLMVVCELIQGAVVAIIALTSPPLAVLLALVALRSTVAGAFQPASRSAVPALVPNAELETANTALGLGTNGFDLLGPLLAAALLPFIGVRELLLVDAASFAVSALLLARLPSLPPARLESERGTLWGDAVAGLRFFRDHRALRVVGLGFFGVAAFSGVDDVALVFLAQESLDVGETGTSLLYAGAGIGLLLGFLALARLGVLVPAAVLTVAGFGISSAGNLFTGLAWALPVALAMQVVRGAGISLIDVGVNTLVQRLVPAGMQGRAFGNLYGAVGLAAGLSYVFGGLLLDAIGPRAILVIAGGGGVAVAMVTWLALPSELRTGSDNPTAEPRSP